MSNDQLRVLASLLRGVMLTSANNSKVAFEPWNQYLMGYQEYYDEWILNGLCHGLSMQFLGMFRQGRNFQREVTTETTKILDRYEKTPLHQHIQSAHFTQMDLKNQNTFMKENYGLTYLEEKKFGNTSSFRSHSRCGSYVSEGTGFFMISSTGHAMAAVSARGEKVFFDPNAGFAKCSTSSAMTSFFSNYFGHEFVKSKYGHGKKVQLIVHKYNG